MAEGTKECWFPEEAQNRIRDSAREDFELTYTMHAKNRMKERGIIVSDIKYILAHGYIDEEPEESTRAGYFKYKICSKSPNSGYREICLVVVPDPDRPTIKIITVMWEDL